MTTHDMRNPLWGNNFSIIEFWKKCDNHGFFKIWSWTPRGVRVGDTFLWNTSKYTVEAVVLDVERMRDPPDMAKSILYVRSIMLKDTGEVMETFDPPKETFMEKLRGRPVWEK